MEVFQRRQAEAKTTHSAVVQVSVMKGVKKERTARVLDRRENAEAKPTQAEDENGKPEYQPNDKAPDEGHRDRYKNN